MLIFIISILFFVVSVTLLILIFNDIITTINTDLIVVLTTISSIVLMCVSTIAICVNSTYQSNCQRTAYNETITELNNSYELLQNTDGANTNIRLQAIEYNEKVKKFKQDVAIKKLTRSNIWINWFENEAVDEYDGSEVQYYTVQQ